MAANKLHRLLNISTYEYRIHTRSQICQQHKELLYMLRDNAKTYVQTLLLHSQDMHLRQTVKHVKVQYSPFHTTPYLYVICACKSLTHEQHQRYL